MAESADIYAWLARSGCQQHHAAFVDNDVTFDLLPELDTDALRELGVSRVGDRLRLEIAIAQLKQAVLKKRLPLAEIRAAVERESAVSGRPAELPASAPDTNSASNSALAAAASPRIVTFILPDGSSMKVNVEGCFSAQSIKRRVLKQLGVQDNDHEYDTFVHSSGAHGPRIASLYDVEFVTICFSPDRPEKHRIMLTPKNEPPTATATEKSLRIWQRVAGRRPAASIRGFFGQRPPSELISSNLGEYFPSAGQHALQATIRNSVRHSMRLSRRATSMASSSDSAGVASEERWHRGAHQPRTIGDVLVRNVNMLDEVKHPETAASIYSQRYADSARYGSGNGSGNGNGVENADDVRSAISAHTAQSASKRLSIMTSFVSENNRHSRIELMSVDSDSDPDDPDDAHDFLTSYHDDAGSDSSQDIDTFGGQKWLQGARIGAGSFGTVCLGMNPMSGELMAVKQVPIPAGPSRQNETQRSMIAALQREMALLKDLRHENIVLYYGSSSDDRFLNIFLEYIPGGSVQSMLQSYGPFEEPLIRNFVRQVLVGLSYLHGVNIIHRDIKGANILIDIKGVAKISDFGISKKVNTGEDAEGDTAAGRQAKRASLQGSVYWMAPEVVKQTAYTKKADIWSVGCLVVEMFTGKHPFPNFSQMQAIFKIGTHTCPEVPRWCTDEGQDFLRKTFEFEYAKRPSAVDLLAESFLAPLIVSRSEDEKTGGEAQDT